MTIELLVNYMRSIADTFMAPHHPPGSSERVAAQFLLRLADAVELDCVMARDVAVVTPEPFTLAGLRLHADPIMDPKLIIGRPKTLMRLCAMAKAYSAATNQADPTFAGMKVQTDPGIPKHRIEIARHEAHGEYDKYYLNTPPSRRENWLTGDWNIPSPDAPYWPPSAPEPELEE